MQNENAAPKLYGKVYFYVKKSRSDSKTESVGTPKHEEIRKIALPQSYDEFYNQIMLSLAKDSKVSHHLSDSVLPLKTNSCIEKKNNIILKYLSSDDSWKEFSSQSEYGEALTLCQNTKTHCLRIRVYYKKNLFNSKSSSKSKKSNTLVSQTYHNLTVCSDFEELQRLLREHANYSFTESSSSTSSPNSSPTESKTDQFSLLVC